jgi:hypothetical protein
MQKDNNLVNKDQDQEEGAKTPSSDKSIIEILEELKHVMKLTKSTFVRDLQHEPTHKRQTIQQVLDISLIKKSERNDVSKNDQPKKKVTKRKFFSEHLKKECQEVFEN